MEPAQCHIISIHHTVHHTTIRLRDYSCSEQLMIRDYRLGIMDNTVSQSVSHVMVGV